jgi:hypothetical protein
MADSVMEDAPRGPTLSPAVPRATMPTLLALVFYMLHTHTYVRGEPRRQLFSKRRVCRVFEDECAICYSAYELGSYQAHMRCGHFFHSRCLTKWLQRNQTCPVCRAAAATCEAPKPERA